MKKKVKDEHQPLLTPKQVEEQPNFDNMLQNPSRGSEGSDHSSTQSDPSPRQPQQPSTDVKGINSGLTNTGPSVSRREESNVKYLTTDNNSFPKISIFVIVLISIGIIFSIFCIIISLFFAIQDDFNNNNDSSSHKVHQDFRCVFLPFGLYIYNIGLSRIFYLQSRKMQMLGYTAFHMNSGTVIRLNFRVSSIYWIISFAFYAYLINHTLLSEKSIRTIYLVIWLCGYFLIMFMLLRYFYLCYQHNKKAHQPELFQHQPIEINPAYSTPPSTLTNSQDTQKVIKQLYSEKRTLQRQLKNVSAQLVLTQNQLSALSNNNNILNVSSSGVVGSPGYGSRFNDPNISQHQQQINQLQEELRNLNDKLRREKNNKESLKTEIKTKQTMLESKDTECEQQKKIIQSFEQRIVILQNEKEASERALNGAYDQKDELQILLQVKEEEIQIAQEENKRLRTNLQKQQQQQHYESSSAIPISSQQQQQQQQQHNQELQSSYSHSRKLYGNK